MNVADQIYHGKWPFRYLILFILILTPLFGGEEKIVSCTS